jgi:TolB-like protein
MRISLIRAMLINHSAKLLSFCMVGFGWSVLVGSTPTKAEEAFDSALAKTTDQIATAVNNANLKAVTVPGFTDLHDNESDLGLFLADQVSAGLVQKKCAVVDRKNLDKILAEHKLTTSGLVDPENAKKLGQFAGVDAIVIGTVIPLSGTIRVTVRVLATDSARVLAAASVDIPKTNLIRDVMGEQEIPEPTPNLSVPRAKLVQPQAPTGSDEVGPANNVTTQQQTVTEAPVEQPNPAPVVEKVDPLMEWVIKVNAALDRHDWRWITQFTVDGHTNYFSHRKVSNQYIANDIANDARRYFEGNSSYHIDTFIHDVSNEYSPAWSGPMLYDSITVDTTVQERDGRGHQTTTRFTVGYTHVDGIIRIYALSMNNNSRWHPDQQ